MFFVLPDEQFPFLYLQFGRFLPTPRSKLIMQDAGGGVEDRAVASVPKPDTIVGFLVIGRAERFVETTELIEQILPGQQQRSGTVIDVSLEHIRRSERIVASAIALTGAVFPDDVSRFLKPSV